MSNKTVYSLTAVFGLATGALFAHLKAPETAPEDRRAASVPAASTPKTVDEAPVASGNPLNVASEASPLNPASALGAGTAIGAILTPGAGEGGKGGTSGVVDDIRSSAKNLGDFLKVGKAVVSGKVTQEDIDSVGGTPRQEPKNPPPRP